MATREILVSHSYKQFLLNHTQGQRLIIDSGSNSFFGIDSHLLEKELNILTINLADNAGYPLQSKLRRIEKYSHQGDIVLLPLEWQYYSYEAIPDIFTNNLLGSLHYYHQSTPVQDIKQIWNTPFSSFMYDVNHYRKEFKNNNRNLKQHIERFNHQERGDFIQEDFVLEFEEASKVTPCDEYVLGNALKNGFTLSSTFKENLKLIQQLQNQGIHIVLTWPVVVGKDCYSLKNTPMIKGFTKLIKKTLNEHNILILGDPYESRFSPEFILNSYYHINAKARDMRTRRLINHLKNPISYSWFNQTKAISYDLDI
ncbi:MAG: hypothetical protein Q9M50_13460 [Methylococcales bacterium]|nr:hypothetical protein [Methylococcales bacterium]